MRFGSVCSGIEAASVAWNSLGWKAAWLSEIEPFPSAVLAHHYPDVPNLGDMTTLPERIRSGEVEAPDVFCGGTPCQAFSVAGLRKSLADDRGNLSLTFCEIADAIDESRSVRGLRPAIVFWENVPGVLSTADNAFGCFLAQLCGGDEPLVAPDGWPDAGCVSGPSRTAAWRILDAQYFGVAQRRRRVFVVASARNDFDPAAVLFEFGGVRRDTPPSREAGKVAPTIPSRSTAGGGLGTDFDCDGGVIEARPLMGTITARMFSALGPRDVEEGCLLPVSQWGDTAGTLTARHDSSPCADRGMNVVAQQVSYSIKTANTSSNGWGIQEEVTHTLDTAQGIAVAQAISENQRSELRLTDYTYSVTSGGGKPGQGYLAALVPVNNNATAAVAQPISFDLAQITSAANRTRAEPGLPASTITKGSDMHVAQPMAFQQTADCLTAAYGTKWNGNASATNGSLFAGQAMQVRRLTPVECERLQGFPDGYSMIPWRNKPAEECPDGPRYKALGNSWAVPVVRWIGKRIQEAA